MSTPRCQFVKKGGEQCKANALPGETFCWVHHPAQARRQAEARKKGGGTRLRKAAVLPPDAPDFVLNTAKDVKVALARLVNSVTKGVIDPRVSNAAVYALATMTKAIETADLEERLAALEARRK